MDRNHFIVILFVSHTLSYFVFYVFPFQQIILSPLDSQLCDSLAPLPSCYVMLNDAHLTCSVSESACYFDNLIPSTDYSRRKDIFIRFNYVLFLLSDIA